MEGGFAKKKKIILCKNLLCLSQNTQNHKSEMKCFDFLQKTISDHMPDFATSCFTLN